MLISKKYLNHFVAVEHISDEELSRLFNNYGGLEVEGLEQVIADAGYVIGKVIAIEKHPDADKLNICTVDVNDTPLQIICGAPNVALNKYVVVAKVGTILPDGLEIVQRAIRGIDSAGMLCSLQEIGMDEKFVDSRYKDGIYLFEDEVVTEGASAVATLGYDDTIFDLSITPNRADCLSYRGVAHEVAALTKQALKPDAFSYTQTPGTFPMDTYVNSLDVTSDKALAYHLLAFQNVTIEPSPQWMQQVLISSNIRPINNVVDITNYVMLTLGLPLHAFDADKLGTKEIIVRQATENEQLVTLDSVTRVLNTADLVISTAKEAIALAGVMGGENTQITMDTTAVVLEAAIFDPLSVRKSAIKFNLRSDASIRFEKGVDNTLPEMALSLTTKLMLELTGAAVAADKLSYTKEPINQKVISFEHQQLINKMGVKIEVKEVVEILESLSFTVEVIDGNTGYQVTAPSWRLDINIFEDVVDEIIRLYGFEHLPNTLPIDVGRPVFVTPKRQFTDSIHQRLQQQGIQEIISYTLLSEDKATLGSYKNKLAPLHIPHALNQERTTLRTTGFYSMIDTLSYHINRQAFMGASLYEMTYLYGDNAQRQVIMLGGYGTLNEQKLYGTDLQMDFYVMKSWVETMLNYISPFDLTYEPSQNPALHPGMSADVYYQNTYLGSFGQIHPMTATSLDVSEDLYLGEFVIEAMMEVQTTIAKATTYYMPVSKYPTIERDLAFVVERALPIDTLVQAIKASAGMYCETIAIFDIYTGEHISDDKKSVALKLQFNNPTQTLTNEYIDECVNKILVHTKEVCGAELRQ